MHLADQAKANAISLEVKKDGLQQRQSGDWRLCFTVASIDMDQRLTKAEMGTRYQCVLVEINDDETPVDHEAMVRDKWRELGPTKQAGMRCTDPVFWAWLEEEKGYERIENHEQAAVVVRALCDVASRRDLESPGNHRARAAWHDLDFAFQAWRAAENA